MHINQAIKTLGKSKNQLILSVDNKNTQLLTNLENNWINIPIKLNSSCSFNCILPPIISRISELINLEKTTINYQSSLLQIQWNTGEYLINSAQEDLEEIPSDNWSNQYIPLNSTLLKLIYKAQNFSDTSQYPTRPELSGVHISINQDKATVTATNKVFLFQETIPFYNSLFPDFQANFLLQLSTIKLLKKLKTTGKLWLGKKYGKIILGKEITIIASISDDYIDLSKIQIPTETTITLNRQELIQKISLLGQTKHDSILFIGSDLEVKLKGVKNGDLKKPQKIGETNLKAKVSKPTIFQVNSSYFLSIVKNIKDPSVKIACNNQIIKVNQNFILALETIAS